MRGIASDLSPKHSTYDQNFVGKIAVRQVSSGDQDSRYESHRIDEDAVFVL